MVLVGTFLFHSAFSLTTRYREEMRKQKGSLKACQEDILQREMMLRKTDVNSLDGRGEGS